MPRSASASRARTNSWRGWIPAVTWFASSRTRSRIRSADLRGAAQLLERELHEHLREYTGVIISEADRLTALVDSMIGPTRMPQKALINIHETLRTRVSPAAQ